MYYRVVMVVSGGCGSLLVDVLELCYRICPRMCERVCQR